MAASAQIRNHKLNGHVRTLNKVQARRVFNAAARRYLKISGTEFLRRWDAGEFNVDPDTQPGVVQVAVLLPLVRG
jgi:hypothetical protein